MMLRRLNDAGVERFQSFLDTLLTEGGAPSPKELLHDPVFSESVRSAVVLEQREFQNRFEAAQYLLGKLQAASLPQVDRDPGLWAWLSLFYFEQLCPLGPGGRRRPGERARWILERGARYHRHLLAGPFLVYRSHQDRPERTLALLSGPLHRRSAVYDRLAENPQFISNDAIVELATRLYFSFDTGALRRGAASNGPGSVARYTAVLRQLDVTYDLYSLTSDQLLELLPPEFDSFRAAAGQQLLAWTEGLRSR